MPKKTITRIRQYIRGSTIYSRPRSYRDFTIIRKKLQSVAKIFFSLSQETQQQQQNPNLKIEVFYILCTGFTIGYKMGQKPRNIIRVGSGHQTGSNKTRLYKAQQSIHKMMA